MVMILACCQAAVFTKPLSQTIEYPSLSQYSIADAMNFYHDIIFIVIQWKMPFHNRIPLKNPLPLRYDCEIGTKREKVVCYG